MTNLANSLAFNLVVDILVCTYIITDIPTNTRIMRVILYILYQGSTLPSNQSNHCDARFVNQKGAYYNLQSQNKKKK